MDLTQTARMPAYRAVLASLSAPPDTSQLLKCTEGETAQAISAVTVRLMRRRTALMRAADQARELEPLVGSLRRLQNPHLSGYARANGTLLSEPFCAIPSVISPAPQPQAKRLIEDMLGAATPQQLVCALRMFGEPALRCARDGRVRIALVPQGRKLSHFSDALAAMVPDIDSWPAPPAGLFVLSERRLLLRSRALRMTAAHEFAHALDSVLAGRPASYFSYESAAVRARFASAPGFVNEYAASGLDEYFAESLRAYVEVNDERSSWLPLTRYDLFTRDPGMFALIESTFARLHSPAQ